MEIGDAAQMAQEIMDRVESIFGLLTLALPICIWGGFCSWCSKSGSGSMLELMISSPRALAASQDSREFVKV